MCFPAFGTPASRLTAWLLWTEFAVNGSNIPDVDFDIGESYAGLLPISDTDNRDNLYFWFFPTANEEFAKNKEIVIWLNGGVWSISHQAHKDSATC